jgi:hypothetical protein
VGVSTAGAGQGSFTQTSHFQSLQQWGTPLGPATNATNCSGPIGDVYLNDFALFDLTGNGVQHVTVNKAGDSWFTTTFTGRGTIAFYPASSLVVTYDNSGNITNVDVVGPPDMIINARLTEWFGFEDNNQNAVGHGTVDAQGVTVAGGTTVPAGEAVSLHEQSQARWAVGTDLNGPPVFFTNKVSC